MKEKIAIVSFVLFIVLANLLSIFYVSLVKDQELSEFFINDQPLSNRYSEREKAHLEEVKSLVSLGFFLLFFSVSILSFIYQEGIVKKGANLLVKIMVPLVIITLLAFTFLFTLFHKAAFRTDTWLLPSNSLLISLYPESFFLVVTIILETLIILEAIIIKKIIIKER